MTVFGTLFSEIYRKFEPDNVTYQLYLAETYFCAIRKYFGLRVACCELLIENIPFFNPERATRNTYVITEQKSLKKRIMGSDKCCCKINCSERLKHVH